MTDGFVIEYIRQRMQELGYGRFHFEPTSMLVRSKEPVSILAYNEFYYLVSLDLPNSTLIIGDTHYLNAVSFSRLSYARLHEFTGNITIECPQESIIEFIRVTPEL